MFPIVIPIQRKCGFCNGTGHWTDSTTGSSDPCPICGGSGSITVGPGASSSGQGAAQAAAATPPAEARKLQVDDLMNLADRLTQEERQRLYEALHDRWDCRMYK